ncbi:MAG TPA: DUF1552 domain-containing protein [Polyangia bacterium]
MNKERFSRRALLKRLGASAAVLPLLHAERARAATASGFPKRFVAVTHGNGVIASSFYPSGTELTAPLGATLSSMEPFKAKMIMPIGLDYKHIIDDGFRYDGHFTYCATLTGTREKRSESRKAMGPSIDQMIADDIAKKVPLKAPLLTIGIKSVGDGCSTSWRAAGQQNVAELDPARLFARIFSGAAMPAGQIDIVRLRQKSVLDYLSKELGAFGKRLGTEDRLKIEAHTQSVRELETRLNNVANVSTGSATCTGPTVGTGKTTDALAKAMFDITAVALKCDVTRVVTITMFDDGGGDGNSFPWVGVNSDYHAVAHGGGGSAANKIKIDNWIYSNVANLAKQLDDTKEGTGTALDNSVIATFSDMDDGTSHFNGKIPITLTGSCGGYLKTGKVYRYSGVAHNKLLTSLCNAMDLPVTGVGAAPYAGNLPELAK